MESSKLWDAQAERDEERQQKAWDAGYHDIARQLSKNARHHRQLATRVKAAQAAQLRVI